MSEIFDSAPLAGSVTIGFRDEQLRRARLTVCEHATDLAEAQTLLKMLGLVE